MPIARLPASAFARRPVDALFAGLFAASMLAGCAAPASTGAARSAAAGGGLDRIEHIVVIYAENRSFDHLFGLFPGAEGLAQATAVQKTQLDHDGTPLTVLPPVYEGGRIVASLPTGMANGPFRLDAPPFDRRLDDMLPSPVHAYFHHREQINGGQNNRFVAMGDSGAMPMGHWDGSKLRLWKWAQDYTLADHFFMAAFGGSFLNHQWLICACTPKLAEPLPPSRLELDANGRLVKDKASPPSVMQGPVRVKDGRHTPDGFAVNTLQPPYQPSTIGPDPADASRADPKGHPVTPQTARTIGDTLSAKGVSWAWYSGGWKAVALDARQPVAQRTVMGVRGPASLNFQTHHQPFNYFARFAPGTADRAQHLLGGDDFMAAIDAGRLPQVSFYKPVGRLSQHPGHGNLAQGDAHLDDVLQRLRRSPQWPRMAVIVTYDENGGYWDHVPPPSGPGWGDRWGPGTRIPALVISPFARRGFVDKTVYDTTSVLKLITRRFGLEPLPGVREKMGDLTAAFDFTQTP